MSDDNELMHIGVLRKSGRYPWGSGKTPHQRNKTFLDMVEDLKSKGFTETQIVDALQLDSTTQLRAVKTIAKNELRKAEATQAQRLKDKGYSNVAIGAKMGKNESSIRALLDPMSKEKRDIYETIAGKLKVQTTENYIDIGEGSEKFIGVSRNQLNTAVAMLKEEGYKVQYVNVPQLGTSNLTSIKILVKPGVTYSEVLKNKDKIKIFDQKSEDKGRSFIGLRPPINVDSKRIIVNYAETGGTKKDGVIELRPGVEDLNIGGAKYAQVRIAVDGTHYLKGMAVYADDLPKGVDIRFNTNKSNTTSKLDTLKLLKDDPTNPFGASIKPGGQRGALNIINEEGDWYKWSKSLSSQMLSKQNPSLIKQQLGLTFESKKAQFEEIMALTNPTIRKKLLESFADDVDSSSVTLKAMGLPRTRSHVILPVPTLKDTEVYAPNYRNGEKVVLIRHPHGGIFEIPELTVNNRHIPAQSIIGRALDAIGINPKVAEQLSGADFDGDTVLVIPNKGGSVKSSKPLQALKDFDPRSMYGGFDGMKTMSNTGVEMGLVSNLITDMTIRGASTAEIARAVRHSMVVIDAEKHGLNYKQSYVDHGISELKMKYQGKLGGGATTLISRSSADVRVPFRKARPASEGGFIDVKTGEKKYVEVGGSYVNKKGKVVDKVTKTTQMEEAKDAYSLSSGTQREALYADHANRLKALANTARKESVNTKGIVYSPSARITYAKEVGTLTSKLSVAVKNKPLERQAQLVANAIVAAKRAAKPDMSKDDLKKVKGQALQEARIRVGAKKNRINITEIEWEAIQSGAISNNRLANILDNADLDSVKKLATPRVNTVMTPAKQARAEAMAAANYTQAEIADALGIPTSTLNSALNS